MKKFQVKAYPSVGDGAYHTPNETLDALKKEIPFEYEVLDFCPKDCLSMIYQFSVDGSALEEQQRKDEIIEIMSMFAGKELQGANAKSELESRTGRQWKTPAADGALEYERDQDGKAVILP